MRIVVLLKVMVVPAGSVSYCSSQLYYGKDRKINKLYSRQSSITHSKSGSFSVFRSVAELHYPVTASVCIISFKTSQVSSIAVN